MSTQKASGCMFGLAFGDALAANTEFMSFTAIVKQYSRSGPSELMGNPVLVTDDTQMTLAVCRALANAQKPLSADTLEPALTNAFVAWMRSPDNDRAPGNTCMVACYSLERGDPWFQATVINSKGCGANMRVAPVGLLPSMATATIRNQDYAVTPVTRAAIAQFQAAMTHGHATGLAASDLSALAVAELAAGIDPAELPKRLREYADSQRRVYHGDWLGNLWERAMVASPEDYIERGWDECLAVLDRLDAALVHRDRESDPCKLTGAGWIAEELLSTALYCFLLYPEDGVAAIRHAAVTSGDSDSIACLTGAFAGAHLGLSAWPNEWVERIEYHDPLHDFGLLWD